MERCYRVRGDKVVPRPRPLEATSWPIRLAANCNDVFCSLSKASVQSAVGQQCRAPLARKTHTTRDISYANYCLGCRLWGGLLVALFWNTRRFMDYTGTCGSYEWSFRKEDLLILRAVTNSERVFEAFFFLSSAQWSCGAEWSTLGKKTYDICKRDHNWVIIGLKIPHAEESQGNFKYEKILDRSRFTNRIHTPS